MTDETYTCDDLIVMSREQLLERGYCCGCGCKNCPYEPKHEEGSTKIRKD